MSTGPGEIEKRWQVSMNKEGSEEIVFGDGLIWHHYAGEIGDGYGDEWRSETKEAFIARCEAQRVGRGIRHGQVVRWLRVHTTMDDTRRTEVGDPRCSGDG